MASFGAISFALACQQVLYHGKIIQKRDRLIYIRRMQKNLLRFPSFFLLPGDIPHLPSAGQRNTGAVFQGRGGGGPCRRHHVRRNGCRRLFGVQARDVCGHSGQLPSSRQRRECISRRPRDPSHSVREYTYHYDTAHTPMRNQVRINISHRNMHLTTCRHTHIETGWRTDNHRTCTSVLHRRYIPVDFVVLRHSVLRLFNTNAMDIPLKVCRFREGK